MTMGGSAASEAGVGVALAESDARGPVDDRGAEACPDDAGVGAVVADPDDAPEQPAVSRTALAMSAATARRESGTCPSRRGQSVTA